MSKPLAYLITWTTYGSWLPGDKRGWVSKNRYGVQPHAPPLTSTAKSAMSESSVVLDKKTRKQVSIAICETCSFKNWKIHALSIESNHLHIVLGDSNITKSGLSRSNPD